MKTNKRWEYLLALDDELLLGGVLLSEWCSFIVREFDTAFASGAFLASILTAVSAIETYLYSEYCEKNKNTLFDLINQSPIDEQLKSDIHVLRKYRNKWVHVENPRSDEQLIETPELFEKKLRIWLFLQPEYYDELSMKINSFNIKVDIEL